MGLVKPDINAVAKIKVMGVGGGGNNAVSSMVTTGKIKGVEFVAVNTDAQALLANPAKIKLMEKFLIYKMTLITQIRQS